MRASLALAAMVLASPARADLYRWVDPDSGSVKFSSQRPLDPRVPAELIPFAQSNPVPAPLPDGAAKEAGADPAPGVSLLESRLQQLLAQLAGVTSADFTRGGAGLRQQVEAYEAVRAELDRVDPAGIARRQTRAAGVLERLREGLRAQFDSTAPALK